jgi:predicted RNase H-like nuclease (RuvC/YqgF family)
VSAQEIAYYKDRYESMRGAFNREFHQTVLMKRQADAAEKERDDYKKKVVELEAKVDFLEEQLGYKRRIADLEKLARLDVTEQEKHE